MKKIEKEKIARKIIELETIIGQGGSAAQDAITEMYQLTDGLPIRDLLDIDHLIQTNLVDLTK